MNGEIEKLYLGAFSEDVFPLVLVGEERAARELVRSFAGAAERAYVIGFARDTAGWRTGAISLVPLGAELTLLQGVRSALRQDPDFIVAEAPLDELPWEALVTCAETGHGVLVRVEGCPDPGPVLEKLGQLPGYAQKTIPRIAVADAKGVARVLEAPEGTPVWTRGDPLPPEERITGHKRFVPAPPAPREPVPPLDAPLLEQLRALLAPLRRRTYVLVPGDASGEAARSKLSGLPLLPAGEEWPRCGECKEPMPLACQLARSEVPDDARALFPGGAEHFQFFYCSSTGCGPTDPAGPRTKNRLIRFVAAGEPASGTPAFEHGFEPRDVTAFEPAFETPQDDDVPGLTEELREARWRLRDRVESGEASEEERELAGARLREKLLGWPHWTQGEEWEPCPRCGERQALLLQVDANAGPLEMLFAADGTGHVTQCPRHRDELAFKWACT